MGTLGIAQTLMILTAGIDLSDSAIKLAVGGMVMGMLAVDACYRSGLLAHAAGLGIGTAPWSGLTNGAAGDADLQLPPFIVTLGTLNVFFALTHLYSSRRSRADPRGAEMPERCCYVTGTAVPNVHLGSLVA